MAVYLITGPSGSGKTTIGIELRKRGYHVVDTDSAFGYLAERNTGSRVEHPGVEYITKEWYDENGWIWSLESVEKFMSKHCGNIVFFCGAADNEQLFYRFFDKIFLLGLRPEVLRQRLVNRQNPDNNPVFIELSLAELSRSLEKAERLNMVVIWSDECDVRNSADAVLERIDENPVEKLSRWIKRVARHSTWEGRARTAISRLLKPKED